jgi:c-di-GMP-related signal transduction protein
LLGELPVSADVRAAVLDHAGPLGKILAEVKRRETDDGSMPPALDTNLVNRAWLEALSWATETQSALR